MLYTVADPDTTRPDWPALFGAARPLHVEVGSGRGHFALDFAAANDVNLVAIEMRRSDCDETRRRRDRRNISNLEMIQGDARLYLPRFFVDESVDAFHIHCPDPWWKKRHHRRRLIADDFALLLWRLLKPGGELDLRTDVPAYAEVMAETCEDLIGYENVHGPRAQRPVEGLVLSTRERRYQVTGQPVFRFEYRRPPGTPRTQDVDRAFVRRGWTDVRRK
jgi:tRNA (guanine-N7-)-methyltransferase